MAAAWKEAGITNLDDFNRRLIAEYRATGGRLGGSDAESPYLLLTTTGARTRLQRTTPLSYVRDGDRFIITSSHGGAPTHSAWFHNLRAHPDATVEVGSETLVVTATVLTGEERDRWFAVLAEKVPIFLEYQARTSRRFPVVALARRQA
jgi:deazaflavin-dependent oxidoreductase (nitroreductase family)